VDIPVFEDAYTRFKNDEANPLDIFIVENEPAGLEATAKFRAELADLISFIEIGTGLYYIYNSTPNCGYEKTCAFSKL
jgi:hypothetical protein